MDANHLETPGQVIDACGGNPVVAEMTGCSTKTVSMWRSMEKLPAKTFLVLNRALLERGYHASPSLWGMAGIEQVAS